MLYIVALGIIFAILGTAWVFDYFLSHTLQENSALCIGLSSGVFTVVVIHLIVNMGHNTSNVTETTFWVLGGVLVMALLFRLPFFHNHEPASTTNKGTARQTLWSDALHNMSDGVLLTSVFTTESDMRLFVIIGIVIHEILMTNAQFTKLRIAGYSTRHMIGLSAISASSIFVGVIGGTYMLQTFQDALIILLSLTIGGFTMVVLHDMGIFAKKKPLSITKIIGFCIGASFMIGIQFYTPHEHIHDHHVAKHTKDI